MPEIVTTDDVLGGDPRIEGHRIGVYHVYRRYVDGEDTPSLMPPQLPLRRVSTTAIR